MMRFHNLTVTEIHRTTRDAVAVTLTPPADRQAAFAFTQGQYLTLRRDFDGAEIRRCYSVCTGVGEPLRIGIKKVPGGAFSTWANTAMQVGDTLEVMPPQGRFHTAIAPDAARHYLMIAGGSGITPILSNIKTILDQEPQARITLLYANRRVTTIMFRQELEDLKDIYLERLSVIHVLEDDAQEIELFSGRITGARIRAFFNGWIDPKQVDLVFICGPGPMMDAVEAALLDQGLTEGQIKLERFASDAQAGRLAAPAKIDPTAHASTLQVTLDGTTRQITMQGQSVLDAALAADLDAPFSCRAGVCSTCKGRITEGQVEMRMNQALEDDEVRDGYVLTCQAHALTAHVAVDYDQ